METILFLLVGLVIGALLGFLAQKSKGKTELEQLRNVMQAELTELERNSAKQTIDLEYLRNDKIKSEKDKQALEERIEELRKENRNLSDSAIRLEGENKKLEENQQKQLNEFERLKEQSKLEFKQLANEILEQNSAKFTALNRDKLNEILSPLNKDIESFKKQVDDVYNREGKERFALAEKVKELAELNQKISDEAKNLTEALKGNSKTQGNWGEVILESILEKSGLRKGEEYYMEHELKGEQGSALKNEDTNKKMRPDAVVYLPGKRAVIIDSKVSLTAYTQFIESVEKDAQESALNNHVISIKNHINSLSSKGYEQYADSLEFVILFMPNEAAYIAAVKAEPTLWNYAYDRKIILMNPTNLITSLKLISDLWMREKQNLNALRIADRGGKLYDKFVGFLETFNSIDQALDRAKTAFSAAKSQLESGRGNLINQSKQLKELGINSKKKDLPAGFNMAEEEEEE
ncbi:MAG: DNA recombination protein RmuC [Luteibaculaceae bacterium]